MNLHRVCSVGYAVSIAMLLSVHPVQSQEGKELTIKAGMLYKTWVDTKKTITCGLTIETPSAVPKDRYPVQVVMIIDASFSMEGVAMQEAKASAKVILNLLADTDMFSCITYSQYAREIVSLQPLNPNNRRSALSAINRIKYEKGRNLSAGMKMGAEQFVKYKGLRTAGKYVLLITNADPNQGTKNPAKLLSFVTSLAKKHNFHITTIGYDRFFNEDFLIGCAGKTGGCAYFLEEEQIKEMTKIVAHEMRRITETCMHKVIVEIITPSGSAIENVYGGTLQENKIVIGDLQAALTKTIMFDLVGRPSRRKDLEINIDYVEPVRMTTRTDRIYVDIPIGSGDPDYDEHFGPLLIDYSTQRGLADAIEQIRDSEEYVRKEFGESFKKTILQMEQDNVILNSDFFSEKIAHFKQVYHDIENEAIEDELLTKRIKYNFLKLTYGTPAE